MIAALAAAGYRVVVTGSAAEHELARTGPDGPSPAGPAPDPARPDRVVNLCGRTSLPLLASVLAGADVVVAPNTGAAHLAAAVATPVVSLFSPVVPAGRWAPYGVPTVLLGDQDAPCARSRARSCPVPGHPCLDRIDPAAVVAAVAALAPRALNHTTASRTAPRPAALNQEVLNPSLLNSRVRGRPAQDRLPGGEPSVAGAAG
jgi:ADP-heptose:LPS heptosyltransferase